VRDKELKLQDVESFVLALCSKFDPFFTRRYVSLADRRGARRQHEWIEREVKIRPIYECLCDGRLQTKTKEFTRLSSGFVHAFLRWRGKKKEDCFRRNTFKEGMHATLAT